MNPGKLLLISILTLSFVISGCSSSDKPADSKDEAKSEDAGDDKKKKDEKPPIPVEIVKLTRGDIQQTYRTITTIEAERDVSVVARTSGLLESIVVEEGDRVTKGQTLAQLDVEQLALESTQFKATLNKLAGELKRQRLLYKRKLGSNDALEKAKFEFEAQTAQYQLAQLKLRYATITAPISGIISERFVKTGNLISINDQLFNIVDPESFKAVLHLPEKELANISKGQQVLLQLDAYANKIIIGSVERIRPMIDTDTGTFKVVATIPNTDQLLQTGMFGRVELVFDVHTNTILLEQQTLITQDNRSHVFVVKDNLAIQTPVKTGFRQNGVIEIIDGLNDSDLVVSTGQQILKHEVKVEIVGEYAEPKKTEDKKKGDADQALAQNP